MITTDPKQVIIVRDKIIKKLRATGFGVHEITDAETKFDTLGVSVDGVRRVVCSTPKRASKVLAVLEFLCSGPRVGGQQLEHVLGHMTCCCVLHRRVLSLLGDTSKTFAAFGRAGALEITMSAASLACKH